MAEERRKNGISREDAIAIATQAARMALEAQLQDTLDKIYIGIGKRVLNKLAWIIGGGLVALGVYLHNNGWKL